MTERKSPLLGYISEEQLRELSEAAARAGMSMQEAINAFAEKVPAFINTLVEAVPKLVDITAKASKVIVDTMMEEVATPKEWHLMNHAKKARTRKKYRNRLLRRLKKGGHHADQTT